MSRTLKDSALKRLKDTYKGDGVVLPAMERHVMRKMGEAVSPHSHDYMHPSDMSKPNWCGRHDFYRMTGVPPEKTSQANPSFRMNNVFAEGHTIHDKYQDWLWEMGVLWGRFFCRACEKDFMALSPKACVWCKSERLSYREVPLRRGGLMLIEGHADGAVHGLDDWNGLIEIKSIGIQTLRFEAPRLYNLYTDEGMTLEDIWWRINRPFASHIKQGMLYLWLAWPRYEEICFIYESKFNQATKEFVVSYNPSVIAPQLETAREVSQCVRTGFIPDRPVWAEDAQVKTCRSCEFRRRCWGMEKEDEPTEEDHPATRVQRAKSTVRKRTLQAARVRSS
jgi:hypothetical protein